MFKSPSRNSRPRGIKVKHVLQICLLLGVCFWLIYQVKHSHDKKKEFDEKDVKLRQSIDELGNFGRKDLRSRPKEVTKNEKHDEEEEEELGRGEVENKPEEDGLDVENKHEEDELEVESSKHEEENNHEVKEKDEEENKDEETEDEERGGGGDEIDENDHKKSEGEADRDEEFVDEDRERQEDDEKESEEKQSQGENENSSEEQDQDGDDQNTHEAREEHYIGDDASSEVTHDTESIFSESVRLSSGNSTKQSEMNILEQENKSNSTSENDSDDKNSVLQVGEVEMAKNGTSLIVNSVEHEGNDNSSNTTDSSVTNSTMKTQSNVHPEESNNSTLVDMKASDTSSEVGTERRDVKEMSSGTFRSPESNGTVALSDSQNMKVDSPNAENTTNVQTLEGEQTSNTRTISESNQSEVNSTVLMEQEKVDAVAGESSTSHNNSEPGLPEKTTETEDGSGSSETKENTDATKDGKSESTSESEGTDESSEVSSRDETLDVVQHDPIDSSDSHIGLDEKEVRTDLDTLPEIRTEGDNSEETAAE